jgi:hypothetical protein
LSEKHNISISMVFTGLGSNPLYVYNISAVS